MLLRYAFSVYGSLALWWTLDEVATRPALSLMLCGIEPAVTNVVPSGVLRSSEGHCGNSISFKEQIVQECVVAYLLCDCCRAAWLLRAI